LPRLRKPTQAMRTVSFGLADALNAVAPKAVAEFTRNDLLFM
jgi:hypothetical protein